jgi:uroporphyrinogen decarboxylase
MTLRERFRAVMSYQPFDRVPVWHFGTWPQTKQRWQREGLEGIADPHSPGPDLPGMDRDWETGLWDIHGLVNLSWVPDLPEEVLEEAADYRVLRTPWGAVHKVARDGGSISQHLEEALKPTRESWRQFRRFVDARDPGRRIAGWERKADALNRREHVAAFLGGSLFAWPREWMGVQEWSYLSYDDPALYEEIIAHVVDYFMEMLGPVLDRVQFDLAYFFEDCCFNGGPLISPDIYRRFYHKHYVRLIEFYRAKGVPFVMLDSDGKVDDLIACWLDSGVDILFPIEVGTWKADAPALRRRFGKRLRMMGGVDKLVIPHGEAAVRRELERVKPLADEGGYVPMPDHRIPPDCSLEAMRTYIRVFHNVFGGPA